MDVKTLINDCELNDDLAKIIMILTWLVGGMMKMHRNTVHSV